MNFYDHLLNSFNETQHTFPYQVDNPDLKTNPEVSKFINNAVNELSDPDYISNPQINQLMQRIRKLLDKQEVSIFEGKHVQSFAIGLLSVVGIKSSSPQKPAMIAPIGWLDDSYLSKYGAIISISSQIITYLDKDTFKNPDLLEEAKKAAEIYEADFLRIKLVEHPELKSTLSKYQQEILDD